LLEELRLHFLEARCEYSGALEPTHWLIAFRNGILAIIAALFEVRVRSHLSDFPACPRDFLREPFLLKIPTFLF
jgi:hypothetical protein